MWCNNPMRSYALENMLQGNFEPLDVGGLTDVVSEFASTQHLAIAADGEFYSSPYMDYHREIDMLRASVEAQQKRASEALECQFQAVESYIAEAVCQVNETNFGISQRMTALAEAACGFSDLPAANVYGTGIDFQGMAGIASPIDLLDTLENSHVFSAYEGLSNLGSAASPYLDSIQNSLSHSFVDELQESLRTYETQEAERFKKLTRAITHVRTLGEAETSNRYIRDEFKRLIARHGPQFTIRQALLLDAISRTAEELLSTRNRRKIAKNLSYMVYAASSGSKILLFYLWLLLLLSSLIDSDLLDPPQLHKLRQSIKCLSPPPDQPLNKIPKVKPNAPNIIA